MSAPLRGEHQPDEHCSSHKLVHSPEALSAILARAVTQLKEKKKWT